MTTWCFQQDIKSTRSSSSVSNNTTSGINPKGGRLVAAAAAGRHSIAQILGLEAGRMATGSSPPDQLLDKMMVINNSDDQPLDLSLDKSKCRAARLMQEGATTNRPNGIKRTVKEGPLEEDEEEHPLSEEDGPENRRDEREEEEEEDWASHRHPDVLQPDHLQMAANFSTVLQYYLTAARLFQANEAMRSCHTTESHLRAGGDDSLSHSEAGNESPSSDPALALTDSAFHQQPAKRRKKDLMIETAVTPTSSALPVAHNNGARPRKTRTTFTGKQLFELERIFEQKKYLSSNERQEVARLLNVTGSQIKIWFQNRRTKWKKQDPSTAAELAQLKSASRSQQQLSAAAGPSSAKTSAKSGTVDSDEDEDGASASSAQAPSPHPPV